MFICGLEISLLVLKWIALSVVDEEVTCTLSGIHSSLEDGMVPLEFLIPPA